MRIGKISCYINIIYFQILIQLLIVLLQMNYHFLNLIVPFPIKQAHLGSGMTFNISLTFWKEIVLLQELEKKKISIRPLLTKEIASYIFPDTLEIDLNMVTHDDQLV